MKKLFLTLITTALAAGSLSAHSQDYTWDAGDDLTGWLAYINAFDTDCTTSRGYGYGYTVNPDGAVGDQVVQLTAEGYMNVFSNYGDLNQPNICLETNVYREVIITAGDEGDYRMNFEPIPPAAVGSDTRAFVKVLDMGYAPTGLSAFAATPANGTVVASIDAADLAGGDLRVQFGFLTVAVGYDDSGMTYDAIAFGEGLAAPAGGGGSGSGSGMAPPAAIPTLPVWGLFGLAGLLGLMGYRRKK